MLNSLRLLSFMLIQVLAVGMVQAASNQSLTYQGILTNTNDEPYTTVQSVEFSILSPAASSCVLYTETHSVTPDSKGRFSVEIGTGTRTDTTGIPLHKVFMNAGSFPGLTCGGGGTSYAPTATDDRSLRIKVNGTVMNPLVAIKSVPFAMQARELNGWGVQDIVKIHPSAGDSTTFTSAEMAIAKTIVGLTCATNEILKWNGSAWICSVDASGGAAGDSGYGAGSKGLVAFDTNAATSGITVASGVAKLSNTGVSANTYGSATAVPTIAIDAQGRITSASANSIALPVGQLTQSGASNGQILKWNGSAWAPAADATGGAPGDASYSAKGLVQGLTSAADSGLMISSGVISVNSGTGADQILKLDGSARIPALDGSLLTNLNVSNVASGVLPIARGGTNNGSLGVTAGGILYMDGSKMMTTAAGTSGLTLISAGASAPFFGNLGIGGGGTGAASFAANSLIMANGSGSALTAITCSMGEILKWDGTAWGCVTGASAISDAGYNSANKGVVAFDSDFNASGMIVASGVAKVNFGTGANQIIKLDGTAKLPPVDGSALLNVNVSASRISGTIGVTSGGTGVTSYTPGDMLYASGSTAISRLGIGANGSILTANGSSPAWNTINGAGIFKNGGNTFGSDATIGTTDTTALNLATAGNARVTILSSGNVGIGVTNPSKVLQVASNSMADTISITRSDNTNQAALLGFVPAGANSTSNVFWGLGMSQGSNEFRLASWDGTTTANHISVSNTGAIGFGATPEANSQLFLRSPATMTGAPIKIQHLKTNGYVAVDFVDSTSVNRGGIGFGNASAPLLNGLFYFGTVEANPVIIRTDDQERIRVLASGQVGIATDSPGAQLDVRGDLAVKSSYEGISNYANSNTLHTIPDTSMNIRRITLTAGPATIKLPAFTNPASTVFSLTVFVKQDATGGRSVSFSPNGSDIIKWDGGAQPAAATTGGKITIYQFMKPADEIYWYGSMVWKEN